MAAETVLFVKVPQALPEHAVPATLHVTPAPVVSLVSLAVKFNVWAWSMLVCVDGEMETVIAGGATAMLRGSVTETGPCFAADWSVNLTVKLVVPAVVGVPEIAPVLLRERPPGSEEPVARLQVRVPTPPLACKVAL